MRLASYPGSSWEPGYPSPPEETGYEALVWRYTCGGGSCVCPISFTFNIVMFCRQLERALLVYYTTLSNSLALSVSSDSCPSTSSSSPREMMVPLLRTLSLCLNHLSVPSHSNLPLLLHCLHCLTHHSAM